MTAMTNLCCNPLSVNDDKVKYDAWDDIRRKKGRSNISTSKRSKTLRSKSKSKSHPLPNNNATTKNRSASVGHKREENRLKMINSNRFNPFTCPCAYPFEDKKTISIQERSEAVIYYKDKLNEDLVEPKRAQTNRRNRSKSRSKSRSRSSSLSSRLSSRSSSSARSVMRLKSMSASRNRYDDKAPKTRLIRVG